MKGEDSHFSVIEVQYTVIFSLEKGIICWTIKIYWTTKYISKLMFISACLKTLWDHSPYYM